MCCASDQNRKSNNYRTSEDYETSWSTVTIDNLYKSRVAAAYESPARSAG
jgi:hypothetical protein